MSLRREFMNYVGTGAIGGIAGYYVGAQELLGIQSGENLNTKQTPEPSSEEQNIENSDEQDTKGNGNTFSIEMAVEGRTRFSETVTVENVSTSQPDIVIGTRYRGEGGCNESTYEANVSNMTMAHDSETNNITNNAPLQDFSRDDRRKEVYSNPADGSDNWTWSFNIEPLGTDIPYPDHWKCYATAHIRLTEGTQWFDNPDQDPPNNTIDYLIARQQPGPSDESGSLKHGVVVTGSTDRNVGRLKGDVDDASNAGRYDWYEEDVEWDITITRR